MKPKLLDVFLIMVRKKDGSEVRVGRVHRTRANKQEGMTWTTR